MTSQLMLGDFAPELNQDLSQYHTPVKLARRMVAWADVGPGMLVLEPSAGGGNIVRELVATRATVEAVEIDPAWVRVLRSEFPQVTVRQNDFMHHGGQWLGFELAVMNPPLDDGKGLAHVAHALSMAPRVVTVLRSQDLHGANRFDSFWCRFELVRLGILVRRPKFLGAGGSSEFVVADIRRPEAVLMPVGQVIEHWNQSWD